MGARNFTLSVTIQLTFNFVHFFVKKAQVAVYIARFFLELNEIKGNLNSYRANIP